VDGGELLLLLGADAQLLGDGLPVLAAGGRLPAAVGLLAPDAVQGGALSVGELPADRRAFGVPQRAELLAPGLVRGKAAELPDEGLADFVDPLFLLSAQVEPGGGPLPAPVPLRLEDRRQFVALLRGEELAYRRALLVAEPPELVFDGGLLPAEVGMDLADLLFLLVAEAEPDCQGLQAGAAPLRCPALLLGGQRPWPRPPGPGRRQPRLRYRAA
jgi:hypothetical protein